MLWSNFELSKVAVFKLCCSKIFFSKSPKTYRILKLDYRYKLKMYKTLPKNVISFFHHFPHFEIFALMPFDRTFASFPSPALPQQDNFYPFPFQVFSSRNLLFSKISLSPIFHPLLFGNTRHSFCKSDHHCTQFSTKSETG